MGSHSSNSTFFLPPETPTFTVPPSGVDLSPLKFIIAFLAIVTIPALAYTCFFSLKCPPSNPFNRSRRREGRGNGDGREKKVAAATSSEVKYVKEASVSEIGGECPVCLGPFKDEEEVRVLGECRHSFHTVCVDLWLRAHTTCPICRAHVVLASVADKPESSTGDRGSRHQSGANDVAGTSRAPPDASDLV